MAQPAYSNSNGNSNRSWRQRSPSPQRSRESASNPGTANRQSPRPGQRQSPIESLHRLRLLVAEAVRYQKKHNSTALHRFVRQRLGCEGGDADGGTGQAADGTPEQFAGHQALTPGLPAELVHILLTDLELVTQRDGAEQAFLQLIELPLWKVEAE
jgi:hypothetical protein